MNKKKLIISVLCMASLFAMPVQAAINACTHPRKEPVSECYSWYEIKPDQHQECRWTVTEVCVICDEDFGYSNYGPWEDHDWDLWNPENGNGGQTVWEGRCITCGYEDTVITYP